MLQWRQLGGQIQAILQHRSNNLPWRITLVVSASQEPTRAPGHTAVENRFIGVAKGAMSGSLRSRARSFERPSLVLHLLASAGEGYLAGFSE